MSQELSEFEKEQLKLQKLGLGLGTGGGIFVGLLDTIVNAVQGKKQREANLQGIRETNATNERLVDKQNAAAAAEAEKQRAYESAPAQVSRLRSAGMSKAGALGAINGAGGYTPAPVNAAQAQAPTQEYQQIDFSGITNALQGMAQLSEQKRVNDAVISKTKADEHKSDVEAQKLEIEKKAEELMHSSNEEIRKNFPALRSFLSDEQFTPSTDSEDIYLSTDEIWKKLESDNKDLYTVTARNVEMRDYVDNYIAYAFDERMRQLGFTTTYQQAKALRQQVSEYLSPDAISLRNKRLVLDLAAAEFEEDYLGGNVTGNETIDAIISKFRRWCNTTLGQKVTSTLFELGESIIAKRFSPQIPGKRPGAK